MSKLSISIRMGELFDDNGKTILSILATVLNDDDKLEWVAGETGLREEWLQDLTDEINSIRKQIQKEDE